MIETGRASIGWIDFPMPPKTHQNSAAVLRTKLIRENYCGPRRVKIAQIVWTALLFDKPLAILASDATMRSVT